MNSPSVGSIDAPTTPESYEPMLKESIDHFLVEFRRGGSDFSTFRSIFFRLIQAMADPPLEIIWFYSAVTFHSSKPTLDDPSKKVLIAKDLFQLLVSCSIPCNGIKNVAVLVPVVYELYNLVCDSSKRDMCLRREIEGLVEGIISYISICCGDDSEEQEYGLDNLMGCSVDLIRVWVVDRVGESSKSGDNLRLFFPLLSDEVRLAFKVRCGMGCLAGVVMSEAFLLRLCLKFGSGVSREELQKDMQNWAVQIIRGFQNCYFLDTLLRMLLEPSLPVTTLLSSEDEVFLRKVLFDAVLLEEYPFLNSRRLTQLPGNHLKNMALIWLFVADNAIQFVRENGDHTRSISYIDAFSESLLSSRLIKWVTTQTDVEEKLSKPNISTPKAIIKWLLVLEDHGVRVFDQNVSKFLAKAVVFKSRVDYELPAFKPDGKNPNEITLFYIGNERREEDKVNGDQEMVDYTLGNSISAAVCTVNLNRRRKRKEGIRNEGGTRIKVVKYDFNENSDGLSNGSKVENPVHGLSEVENTIPDEDMEDMG